MTQDRPDLLHKSHAPKQVRFMLITVSDSRTPETDTSGQLMRRLAEEAGHAVTGSAVVPDDPPRVEETVLAAVARGDVDVVVLNGGTGMSSRDGTYEVVSRLLDKRMDGFGELFRMLSWQQVGSAAMLSRAVGGICRGKAVFSVPGSPKAGDLAMRSLILPEAGHLVFETRR